MKDGFTIKFEMSFVTPYDFGKQRQSIKKLTHENRQLFLKYRKFKTLYEQSQSQIRSTKKSSKLNTVLEKMNKLRKTNIRLKAKIAELEHHKILYERFNPEVSMFIDGKSPRKNVVSDDEEEEEEEEVYNEEDEGAEDKIIDFQPIVIDEDDMVDGGTLAGSLKTALGLQEKRIRHFKIQFQQNITFLEDQLRKEKERSSRLQKKLNHYQNHVHDLEKHIEKLECELEERENLKNIMQDELNESNGNLKDLLETVKMKEEEILKIKSEKILEKSFFGSGLGKELLEQSENKDLSNSILGDVSLLRTDTNNSLLEDSEPLRKKEMESFSTHVLVGSDHPDCTKLLEYIVSNEELSTVYSFSIVSDQMSAMQVLRGRRKGKFGCLLYFMCNSEFMNENMFRMLRRECDRVCIVGIRNLCPKKDEIMDTFNDNTFLYFNELRDEIVLMDNIKNSERNKKELRRLMKLLEESRLEFE